MRFYELIFQVFNLCLRLRHRQKIFLLLLAINSGSAKANDSAYEKKLMERIYKAQSTGTKDFDKGLFPSYREYYFNRGTLKDDDNVFFTALIYLYTGELKAWFE